MELDLGLESIEARLGSCPGVGLSYNLKKYGQESDTQEAPGAEHKFTKAGHKLHSSCWRGSVYTARAAVAHIWPPRSSDIWPPSYTPTFCSSNKFLSSQRIPGAQMTNTSEWPRASSKGESLVFFLCSKTLTCYPSSREQV